MPPPTLNSEEPLYSPNVGFRKPARLTPKSITHAAVEQAQHLDHFHQERTAAARFQCVPEARERAESALHGHPFQ